MGKEKLEKSKIKGCDKCIFNNDYEHFACTMDGFCGKPTPPCPNAKKEKNRCI